MNINLKWFNRFGFYLNREGKELLWVIFENCFINNLFFDFMIVFFLVLVNLLDVFEGDVCSFGFFNILLIKCGFKIFKMEINNF